MFAVGGRLAQYDPPADCWPTRPPRSSPSSWVAIARCADWPSSTSATCPSIRSSPDRSARRPPSTAPRAARGGADLLVSSGAPAVSVLDAGDRSGWSHSPSSARPSGNETAAGDRPGADRAIHQVELAGGPPRRAAPADARTPAAHRGLDELGLLVAALLAGAIRRFRWTSGPITAVTTLLYAIPAVALFAALIPWLGTGTAVPTWRSPPTASSCSRRSWSRRSTACRPPAGTRRTAWGSPPGNGSGSVEVPLACPPSSVGSASPPSHHRPGHRGRTVRSGGFGNLIDEGQTGLPHVDRRRSRRFDHPGHRVRPCGPDRPVVGPVATPGGEVGRVRSTAEWHLALPDHVGQLVRRNGIGTAWACTCMSRHWHCLCGGVGRPHRDGGGSSPRAQLAATAVANIGRAVPSFAVLLLRGGGQQRHRVCAHVHRHVRAGRTADVRGHGDGDRRSRPGRRGRRHRAGHEARRAAAPRSSSASLTPHPVRAAHRQQPGHRHRDPRCFVGYNTLGRFITVGLATSDDGRSTEASCWWWPSP